MKPLQIVRLGGVFPMLWAGALIGAFALTVTGWRSAVAAPQPFEWQRVDIGGGGFVTGIDFSVDGSTRVARTDAYGAYIWDSQETRWQQLITATSMPASDVAADRNVGVFELRIAPSKPGRLYMAYDGTIYRSDDRGRHWSRTNFSPIFMNANDDYRMVGQKLAVDPHDPNAVFFGSERDGLFGTKDGGATWQRINSVPPSDNDQHGIAPGISGIAFATTVDRTGQTIRSIFAASHGHGVYRSIDGGNSWMAIGGPSAVHFAAVADGGYYAAGSENTLWRYKEGTWNRLLLSDSDIATVAINPHNPNEIVIQAPNGRLNVSYDGGASWSGSNSTNRFRANDIPWLAGSGNYMTVGGTLFDPEAADMLWTSDGVGIWHTQSVAATGFQSTTQVVWDDQSLGIETLNANQVLLPPHGHPVLASWDRPAFYVIDPAAFPSAYGPDNLNAIVMGWALDYVATEPSFIVGLFDWGVEKSGYSDDGGRTWHAFASYPPTVADAKIGGSIAASSTDNFVWVPSNNASPYDTVDGGVTWTRIAIPGVPSAGETGWGWAYYFRRRIVAADRVVGGTFYLYNYLKGLFRSSDRGITWALVHAGEIAPFSGFSANLQAVPGHAGHLFFTSGPQGTAKDHHPADNPFMRSVDGGATWTTVPNVLEVRAFGFGLGRGPYPAVLIVGWVDKHYGIWRSDDGARSWTQLGEYPLDSLDTVTAIDGDKTDSSAVYIGFGGSGYAYGRPGSR